MVDVVESETVEEASKRKDLSVWSILGRIMVLSGHLMCFVTVVAMFIFFVPKMEAQFLEMLDGQPLPALTRWVLAFRMFPIVLSFLIITFSASILALGARVPKSVAWLNTLALVLHCLLIGITILSLYLPYIKLVEQIGS